MFGAAPPDLGVLNVTMPLPDGLGVLRHLRKSSQAPGQGFTTGELSIDFALREVRLTSTE